MHGKGLFCYASGEYVEGTFVINYLSGPACLTYPDGSYIKGNFNRGSLTGRVLKYDAKQGNWKIEEYRFGKAEAVSHQGQGKPIAYGKIQSFFLNNCLDFWFNTYGDSTTNMSLNFSINISPTVCN